MTYTWKQKAKRNAQLIRQVRSGKPKNKVAAHFGLSPGRVSHILKRFAPELGKFGGEFFWHDWETARLTHLRNLGLSFSAIALETGWTRGKVAGKIFRLRQE